MPIINIKKRKTDSEKQQIVLDLVLMDDAMFESMCQSPEFVEELLQTILNDSKLHIKSETLMAQKSIRNLRGRSIRMDAYVEGQEGNAFNVEVQKSDNCNHVKRVRYNASLMGLFHKKELDNLDKELFPNTYTQFTKLKNDNREVARMCDKIQNYAKKEAIYNVIEVLDRNGFPKKKIIKATMDQFHITKEEAESYYDDVFITK